MSGNLGCFGVLCLTKDIQADVTVCLNYISLLVIAGVKSMIEDIFLTYANASLKDNPEIFYEIFKKFRNLNVDIHIERREQKDIYKIISHFVKFVKCDDIKKAEGLREKFRKKLETRDAQTYGNNEVEMPFRVGLQMRNVNIAFEGVYGYRDGYCDEGDCHQETIRKDFIGEECFIGPKRLKCHECGQLEFKKILDEIVKGKEYSEIGQFYNLEHLLINANNWIGKLIVVNASSESTFKEELRRIMSFDIGRLRGSIDNDFPRSIFDTIFYRTIVGYSLAEFLLKDDRRKLKRCKRCDKFFVSQKVDDRIKYCQKCSHKSSLTNEQRREYMRKYRRNKKKEKHVERLEARIENLMDNLGCTREEAVEIIEADSNV